MIPWAYGLRSPNGVEFQPRTAGFISPTIKANGFRRASSKRFATASSTAMPRASAGGPARKMGDMPEMTRAANLVPVLHDEPLSHRSRFGTPRRQVRPVRRPVLRRRADRIAANAMQSGRSEGPHAGLRVPVPHRLSMRAESAWVRPGRQPVRRRDESRLGLGRRPAVRRCSAWSTLAACRSRSIRCASRPAAGTCTSRCPSTKPRRLRRRRISSSRTRITTGRPTARRRSTSKQNAITAIRVSDDGKTVSIDVPQRDKQHVFHLQLKGLTTADGTAAPARRRVLHDERDAVSFSL